MKNEYVNTDGEVVPFQKEQRRPNGTLRVQTNNVERSMTQQQYQDECDINFLMKKYDNNINLVPPLNRGVYADMSEIPNYQEMLQTLDLAETAFMALPAQVRKRFGNDPGNLIEFLQDPNNYDEGVKLGLLNKRPDDQITPIKSNDSNDKNEGEKRSKADLRSKPSSKKLDDSSES